MWKCPERTIPLGSHCLKKTDEIKSLLSYVWSFKNTIESQEIGCTEWSYSLAVSQTQMQEISARPEGNLNLRLPEHTSIPTTNSGNAHIEQTSHNSGNKSLTKKPNNFLFYL